MAGTCAPLCGLRRRLRENHWRSRGPFFNALWMQLDMEPRRLRRRPFEPLWNRLTTLQYRQLRDSGDQFGARRLIDARIDDMELRREPRWH